MHSKDATNNQTRGELVMENKNYEVEVTIERRVEVLEEGVMGINEPSFCVFCNPIVGEIR